MSDTVKRALRRGVRVFVAGAIVGGISALRGDADFGAFLQNYAVEIALIAGIIKYLRDKFNVKWLPI